MFKTAFLHKKSITRKIYNRFFSNFSKWVSELSSLISASFEVNRDCKTRCTECWPNLTLKCNVNTFVKVDGQIEEECRQTISYLQRYSCPKLYCKKLSYQTPTANKVRQTRRTTLCWMRGKIKELPIKLIFVFVSLFSKPTLTKQKYNIYEKPSTLFSVPCRFPFWAEIKPPTPVLLNIHFSAALKAFVLGNLFKLFRLVITFAREVCHLGIKS